MNILLGLILGIAAGAAQFYLLIIYNKGVTRRAGGETTGPAFMLAGAAQLVMPFALLVIIAFLYTDALLWCGIGLGTTLIVSAFTTAFLGRRRK